MGNITTREKAAILLHVSEPNINQLEIYKIGEDPERLKRLKDSTIKKESCIWINSERIQEAIKAVRLEQVRKEDRIREEERQKAEAEPTKEGRQPAITETNFLDRDEFLSFLNTRANEIQDDKLRNDILKMLSDNLRYKDTERDENNEIQRFYTPVICESCPIYQKCSGCSGCSAGLEPR